MSYCQTYSMTKANKQQQSEYPFDRFASIRRYSGFDFLKKDPSWIIYIADTNGQFNLWRQRCTLGQEDGISEAYSPYQLTNFIDDTVRNAFTSPVDNSIIFFADHQGTENFQIYTINDSFHSWPRLITQNPKTRYEWGAECFSHNGKFITYSSNESNPMDMLAYVRDLANDEAFCITDKPGWYTPGYWSPDSTKINCSQLVTLTDYTIWLLDIGRNEMVQVTSSSEEKSRNIVGPWLPDGQGFYVITDLKREYAGLAFYDIIKSKLEWILTPEHDIGSVDLSKDGKILVWTENVDGHSNIYTKNTQNGEIQEISEISKKGVIGEVKISSDGKRIGVIMTTPKSPSNIYVIDMQNMRVDKLTESLIGNIPSRKMIQPELIKYKSFDGLEIQAFLYRARQSIDNNNNDNNRFGALLSIHGGPTAQERPTYAYAGFYQYLANNGIAVLAPNFRGSTGYGKSFEKRIYHDWGGNELKDLEYAIKWMISQNWIDNKRIGVFGASFGGFATLGCITRLPE
jgi:dipeptidyl aminopeptidase/acylaminoacyl peptidase